MRYYLGIVHKDPDSGYGIHFPDVPGCFSVADELDEIIPNAIEALSLYATDGQLPGPRRLETLRKDPSVAEDLAAGAFLMAIPLIENDAQVVRANITMEAGILRAIDETAKARGLSRSAFLAQAARQAIER